MRQCSGVRQGKKRPEAEMKIPSLCAVAFGMLLSTINPFGIVDE
jgi:hypothetical protein